MSAGTYNIICEQGATFSRVLTWKDQSGGNVNLTGYTARMQVSSSTQSIILLSTTNGRIALGGSAGTITLSLTAAETTALSPLVGSYDLVLTDGSGTATRLLQGTFNVEPGITL